MKKACLLLLLLYSFYSYTTSDFKLRYTTPIECEDVLADQQYTPEGFIASTHVKTLDGYKQIEALNVGDTIIGFDHIDGLQPQQISNITKTTIEYCIKIVINHEIMYVAPHQKFYLPEYDAWVEAQDLMPGDILSIQMQERTPIESIEQVSGSYDIYSITVDGHTFFVTPNDIFVHNSSMLGVIAIAGMGKMIEAAPVVAQKTAVWVGAIAIMHPGILIPTFVAINIGAEVIRRTWLPTPGKKTVVLPEREYYEKMHFELCQLQAEFLKIKDGLEAVLLGNRTLDHSLTNMLLRATRYTVPVAPFKVTVQQEQAYTEAQKANLTLLRQADLDNIQAQIVKVQVDLAYHFDVLIRMRNQIVLTLNGMAAQKNHYVYKWNASNIKTLSNDTAMGMYEVVLSQQYLLQCIKSKNQEIRAAINFYKSAQCAMVLRKTSNLDEVISAEEQKLAKLESIITKHACHNNQRLIEDYFLQRNCNLAQIRNNLFSKVQKKQGSTFSNFVADSQRKRALVNSPQAPKNDDDDDKNKKKEEEKPEEPKWIREDKVPKDEDTILCNGTFKGLKKYYKGAEIYQKDNRYYYRDTKHTGRGAHLEVFNCSSKEHLGKANVITGEIIPNTAKRGRKFKIS